MTKRQAALQAALDEIAKSGSLVTVVSAPSGVAFAREPDAAIIITRTPTGGIPYGDLPEDPEHAGARLVPENGRIRLGPERWAGVSAKAWRSVRLQPDGTTEWIPARAMLLDMEVRVVPGEEVRISEITLDGADDDRCEAERAQLADDYAALLERSTKADLAREEERKAWARFVGATIDYTQAQMVWAAGPVAEIVPFCEGALKSLDEATEALAVIGVDVVAYLEAGE